MRTTGVGIYGKILDTVNKRCVIGIGIIFIRKSFG